MNGIKRTRENPGKSGKSGRAPASAAGAGDAGDQWWRGAVIYQIYPRSYQDSNGDGIGDLAGIERRLEHIASLGVDAVWISPFFQSPMEDFGYDVSDYRAIHPMFGDMKSFEMLLGTAHRLGLRVMCDLVLSHTSSQHDWFIQSRRGRDNAKSDWYVWADAKPDGTPPNNWLSIFGGPAWQWDGGRQQYYLHNFLTSQPDLNFHNGAVQDALLDVTRFWLERGVDGFRLDTINFYFHDAELRDNPPLDRKRRNDSIAPMVNPYNHQDHIYSKNRPENLDFLVRFRDLLDEYDARACVGEVGDAQRGIEILGQYTAGGRRAHMCYAFDFLEKTPADASWVAKTFERLETHAGDAWPCWAFSNHDVERHATRWQLGDAALRAYQMLLMSLRGSACIYQGEELGLGQADVPFEALRDPYGIEFWPAYKGRDGCRTPMVWEHDRKNGGFSEADPWLPVGGGHAAMAVDLQERDPASLLHHYRRSIALRKRLPALLRGAQEGLRASGALLTFMRAGDGQRVFCAFNLGEGGATCALPAGEWRVEAAAFAQDSGGQRAKDDGAKGTKTTDAKSKDSKSKEIPLKETLRGDIALGPWGYVVAAEIAGERTGQIEGEAGA